MRIITERLILTSSGTFALATENSTKPVASVVTHRGITQVKRWQFGI